MTRWWICGLLFLATVLNYLDRQVLALTAERVMGEFHLNKEQFGGLVASFRYAYALFQIGGGWLVDAAGSRYIYPAALGLWSCAGVLTGFSFSMASLAAYRFLLGTGEAFNWPCALQVTQRILEPRDRALANGIFNGGTAIGAMLAPVVVTLLVSRFGWRSPFVLTGLAGVVWIGLWHWSIRGVAYKLGGHPTSFHVLLGAARNILNRRIFWSLAISAFIINSVSYFLADWIPLYLKSERGFSFGAGNLMSIAVYAGLDIGSLLSGFAIRGLIAAGRSAAAARRSVLLLNCVLMSFAPLAGLAHSRYLGIACLTLTALGVAGFLVIYLTMVQEVDPARVGLVAGMLGGLGNVAYALVSPQIGRLSDLRHTDVVLLMAGLLPWLAFAAIARDRELNPA